MSMQKKWQFAVSIAATMLISQSVSFAEAAHKIDPDSVPTSTGKLLAASPDGFVSNVGSFPDNAILDSKANFAIVSDSGFRQSLSSIDLRSGKVAGSISFNNQRNGPDKSNGLYYGLAISGQTIYASQGVYGKIAVANLGKDGSITLQTPILGQTGDFIAGLASDLRGNLYAVNSEYENTQLSSDPLNLTTPGSLAIYRESTGKQIARVSLSGIKIPLPATPFTPTSFPFAVATLNNGATTYVTSQRDSLVYVINTFDPVHPTLLRTIPVGKNPVAEIISKDQSTLFVANANSDTISVISTEGDAVIKTLQLRTQGLEELPGATPLSMALSPDGTTLYVALGDMNCVAIVDPSSGIVRGYIPAGWYPTSVLCTGPKLIIVNAKGMAAQNPNDPSGRSNLTQTSRFILNILDGTTQIIDCPNTDQLATDTQTVIRRNKLANAELTSYGVLNRIGLKAGKIKHVIYIVKENRTYDQVLGDVKEGNGDPSLAIFGKTITPNLHALAKRFVLLDNFYDSGDVSGDGWSWSTQGYASEYVARNVPYYYSGRGREYDFEGQNNGLITGGFTPFDPDGNLYTLLAPAGVPAVPDVAASAGGYIWDDALGSKLTIRNYGFFYSQGVKGVIPDNYPCEKGIQPPGHDLAGNSDPDFRRFDLDYPDSNAPEMYYTTTADSHVLRPEIKYGRANSPSRYAEWAREFDMTINADPGGSKVPNLMMVRLMCDHTSGMRSGSPTPESDVADNDYAVGELVEHVSKSPIWKNTAIFVIEDDAQDGEDHVDCHRSVCFVASPYIKQGSVDHRFYNTDSVLRTMEALLGMKPMCQFDAIAEPVDDFMSKASNDAQFSSILPTESIIAAHNPKNSSMLPNDPRRKLTTLSDSMDFSHADGAPVQILNSIIWKSVKGSKSTPPKPKHKVIASGAESLDFATGKLQNDD